MTGVVLCVGALSLDTIAWFDDLPTNPGKHLPSHPAILLRGGNLREVFWEWCTLQPLLLQHLELVLLMH